MAKMKMITLIVLFALSIGLVGFGWNFAKNNPRDGWSIIKIRLGLEPIPGSGDRAYFVAGQGLFAKLDPAHPNHKGVMVLVRRDTRGLFIPWNEKHDLRMISLGGAQNTWFSGSQDPEYLSVLRSARSWYEQQGTGWHDKVVHGIDRELNGEFPEIIIRTKFLILDVLIVLAHGVLLGGFVYLCVRLWKFHSGPISEHYISTAALIQDS